MSDGEEHQDGNENGSDPLKLDNTNPHLRRVTDPLARVAIRALDSDIDWEEGERTNAAEDDLLNSFAKRTVLYVPMAILLILFLYVMEYTGQASVSVLSYGLGIEVLGAIILGRGLLSGPTEIASRSLASFGGPIPHLRIALAQDTVDGMWGIAFIVTGAFVSGVSTITVI